MLRSIASAAPVLATLIVFGACASDDASTPASSGGADAGAPSDAAAGTASGGGGEAGSGAAGAATGGTTTTGGAAGSTGNGGASGGTTTTGGSTGNGGASGGTTTTGGSTGNGGASGTGTSGAAGSGASGAAGSGASGGGAGTTGGSAGSGAVPGDAAPESDAATCSDSCPFASGIAWECRTRFMYGVNYAWHVFAGDFGGIPAWGQPGVAGDAASHDQKLGDMAAHGASTIRWWMFPEFRGNGVTFDGSDVPTGLGATTIADIGKALELAEKHDVYLMLTLFSFDNFYPSRDVGGLWVRSIEPMVTSASLRAELMDEVVRPVAATVQASPYRKRVIAWDVINEPEWAMSGPSPYGDPDYTPNGALQTVSHAAMETFVSDVIAVLRQESSALVSVGSAAVKWKNAWTHVDVDFYQLHTYDWINAFWPYDQSPTALGLTDKPVVMGEFPLAGLSGAPYATLLASWYGNGYAGALGWHYDEATAGQLDDISSFAAQHACETAY